VTTGRYRIYRVLKGADASPDLLSLKAQHPGAKVDSDAADYVAERCRLHGG
jgi:hypothetical protein